MLTGPHNYTAVADQPPSAPPGPVARPRTAGKPACERVLGAFFPNSCFSARHLLPIPPLDGSTAIMLLIDSVNDQREDRESPPCPRVLSGIAGSDERYLSRPAMRCRPPILAASACAASWQVVEKRNATYQIKPARAFR